VLASGAMRAFLLCLFVLGPLLSGGAALAQRKPQEFVAPREMTQAELEEAKARSKNRIDSFGGDAPVESAPFPWRAVILMGLVMVVALPFGIQAYLRTSRDLSGNKAFGAARPAEDE
jgi:hypothetical protein